MKADFPAGEATEACWGRARSFLPKCSAAILGVVNFKIISFFCIPSPWNEGIMLTPYSIIKSTGNYCDATQILAVF